MAREVYKGTLVIDQFPVFEPDGVTLRSGEQPGDFTVRLFHDGTEVSASGVTISEIGSTGFYSASFTPDETGFWRLVVFISYNREVWGESFDVVAPVLLGVA